MPIQSLRLIHLFQIIFQIFPQSQLRKYRNDLSLQFLWIQKKKKIRLLISPNRPDTSPRDYRIHWRSLDLESASVTPTLMQPDMQACSPAARVCRRPAIDYFYLWTRPKKRSTAFPKVSRRILIGETSLVSLLLSSPKEPTLENFRALCGFSKANRLLVHICIHDERVKMKFLPVIEQTVFYRSIDFRVVNILYWN